MPELPDIVLYLEALHPRIVGQPLEAIRVASPFLVRTVEPPIAAAAGRRVSGLRRLGKRLVVALDPDLFLVLHLMIAGRLRWKPRGARLPGRVGLAALDFASGTLVLTEAGTRRRAALHLVRGDAALAALDAGGLDALEAHPDAFRAALRRENHTLKRALGDGFPERVTAFREGMAVHGRYRRPCPVCGAAVQRVRYAENEMNYCARCQTGGVVFADRALSRLLREEWPRSLDEWELRLGGPPGAPGG